MHRTIKIHSCSMEKGGYVEMLFNTQFLNTLVALRQPNYPLLIRRELYGKKMGFLIETETRNL